MTAGISLRIPRITDLEHWDSVVPRFRALADLPWAIWLDSAAPGIGDGRYSILAADPYLTLRTRGELTTIARRDGGTRVATESPLELLRLELGEPGAGVGSLPFCGGALGYFGYDLGRRYEKLPALAVADIDMPELAVGLYDWAVVVDHLERRSWLVGQGRDPETFAHWDSLLERLHAQRLTSAHPFKVLSPVSSNLRSRELRGRIPPRAGLHSPRRLLSGELDAAVPRARRGRRVARVFALARDQSGAVLGFLELSRRQSAVLIARTLLARGPAAKWRRSRSRGRGRA